MCQEQAVLREQFTDFIETMADRSVDLHTAVTTTHFNEQFPFEKIARPGHLQSTPHPPVGAHQTCRSREARGSEPRGGKYTGEYAPVKRQIEQAVKCTAGYAEDPSEFPDELRELYDPEADRVAWSDQAFECAFGAPDACNVVTDQSGGLRVEDLFPCAHLKGRSCERSDFQEVYRDIPKVLRASDYRDEDGTFRREEMVRDFQCMSFVGTRGDGNEQGLRAAATALSPRMTGGPVGDPIEDPSAVQADGEDWSYPNGDPSQAPNHGFLRQDAQTAVVFMTDENDCSRPDDVSVLSRYDCGDVSCYFAAQETRKGDGPLFETGELAERFRQNLAASKRIDQVDGDDVTVATIDGGYTPYEAEIVKDCGDEEATLIERVTTCRTELGTMKSSDRYRDFAANFERAIPEDVGSQPATGRMCQSDGISQTMTDIAEAFEAPSGTCIDPGLETCQESGECAPFSYRGDDEEPSRCRSIGGDRVCASSLRVQLEYVGEGDARENLRASDLCYEESIGAEGEGSCIVRRTAYSWSQCRGEQAGLAPTWNESVVANPARQLQGFDVKVAYRTD